MKLKMFLESIKDLDPKLDVTIRIGEQFYGVDDVDWNSLQVEIYPTDKSYALEDGPEE